MQDLVSGAIASFKFPTIAHNKTEYPKSIKIENNKHRDNVERGYSYQFPDLLKYTGHNG